MIIPYLLLLGLVLWIMRINWVSTLYSRALRATSTAANRDILAHRFNAWLVRYQRLAAYNFPVDVLNLRKWRYEEFFPDIPEVEDADR